MPAGETWLRGVREVEEEVGRRGGRCEVLAGRRGPGGHHLSIESPSGRWLVRLKTKSSGTWQDHTENGAAASEADADDRVWIYVDVGPQGPAFFIAPGWWAVNDIHQAHEAYLQKHGGRRARSQDTTHHAIRPDRVEQWRDRWDVLGL